MRRPLFAEQDDLPQTAARRRGHPPGLDVVPLINLALLLLLVWLVLPALQARPVPDLPPARFGVEISTADALVITLSLPGGANETPVIRLGANRQPAASLEEVREFVAAGRQSGKTSVLLLADRNLSHGAIETMIKALGPLEGMRLSLGVRPP